jgi:superfamily II DNA or RNA helicase
MELKKYQQTAIETLSSYLKELEKFGPKHAFISVAGNSYNEDFFGDVPFLCVKIPTGGGKTLVGCHMTREIMQGVLKNKLDRGVIMWFVPSEAIKSQTLKKFKDKNDPHRKVLDEAFENSVRIFSNEEALSIRREDVSDNVCIIISSLDAFRKEKSNQKKYKVYQENGALLNHFEHLNDDSELEKDEEDTVINSLANVVRMSNPLIVVDEGHKTQTKLSVDFLKDLNPSFVIEYTATPRGGSNILVNVHSSELKGEQMVKIPIVLESSAQWQNSIAQGIDKRNELEKHAKKLKGEYIRPIALLQAQPKNTAGTSVTVDQVKEYLLTAKISEDEIAIKTSEKNELEGVDLFNRKCKIRYIITVNALAEGWDCSFAYVLVSVANLGAKIAVEQIIGRIIRMPYAKRKNDENLNRSYIFASAKNFNEAAGQIISGLEDNGYSRFDLISSEKKDAEYELEVKKMVKETLKVPMVSLEEEKLAFEDLVGEDFELAEEDPSFNFEIHYDNDGRAIIDIREDDKWIRGAQQTLNLTYKDKNFSKAELIQWLDKKLRFIILDKPDKVKFIEKAVDHQLKEKSLAELSVNRYLLADKLSEVISGILESYAKKRFDKFLKAGSITVKATEKFPDSILLKQEIPQEFNKNYYGKIDKLNKEELNLVERLDLQTLPNIEYWARNREKLDPFYIQGWKKNKFYPDFVVVTKKGNTVALEWKGEDRVSNEDTEYKTEIGEMWAKLGRGRLHFFLVHNKNIDEVLNAIKNL